jgi:hypothetical protein
MTSLEVLYERKEIVQEVIDRLLTNPKYKKELLKFNKKHPINIQIKKGLRTVQQ